MNTKERTKEGRTPNRSRQKPQKDVVYTQPKPFNRNRFFLQLATTLAVVIALLAGMAIFFKVEDFQVSGAVRYDPYGIFEDSGIKKGDSMITLNKRQIVARILDKDENSYIKTVRINRKLPGTVVISITEEDVFYAAQDSEGGWWLLSPSGKVIDKCSDAEVDDYTKILGVKLSAPERGATAAGSGADHHPAAGKGAFCRNGGIRRCEQYRRYPALVRHKVPNAHRRFSKSFQEDQCSGADIGAEGGL